MGRGRSAGYDDQRDLILEQAGRLFALRGYPATSMNQVAEACGLSKATLYHYYKDKYALLVTIAESHVTRLATLIDEAGGGSRRRDDPADVPRDVSSDLSTGGPSGASSDEQPDLPSDLPPDLPPDLRLRRLIRSLVEEYSTAQSAHRVLTEDVRFLTDEDRERVLDQERRVVRGFSRVVLALRPDLEDTPMGMPLTMLLFGMINWMFTWMKADGALDYDDMAPIVADLFLGGLPAVKAPIPVPALAG